MVDGVADTLKIVHHTEHSTDALGALMRKVAFGNTGEEGGYFHFHTVGYLLILFDTLQGLIKLLVGFGGAESWQERIHAEDTFWELGNLTLGSLEVEFGSAHPSTTDVLEFVDVFLVFGLTFDHPVDDAEDAGDKPSQDECIDNIEEGMEKWQSHRNGIGTIASGIDSGVRAAAYYANSEMSDEVEYRTEYRQGDKDTNNIENQMGTGRLLTIGVGHHGGNVGSDGGADILAHDKCHRNIKTNPTIVAHNQSNGHHGSGSLNKAGEQGTDQDKDEYGPEAEIGQAGKKSQKVGILLKIGHCLLEKSHADKQQSQTNNELTYILETVTLGKHEK